MLSGKICQLRSVKKEEEKTYLNLEGGQGIVGGEIAKMPNSYRLQPDGQDQEL